jgi:hypothetical protein
MTPEELEKQRQALAALAKATRVVDFALDGEEAQARARLSRLLLRLLLRLLPRHLLRLTSGSVEDLYRTTAQGLACISPGAVVIFKLMEAQHHWELAAYS